ncbi:hypothetical protein ACIBD9_18005 [Micromonospora sp. NPDC050784]|uniref:hypothetical protein n=1 Tax=Micromonospora sp. NPDC050784 TaxID=3364281 RepID=UPI0037B1713C
MASAAMSSPAAVLGGAAATAEPAATRADTGVSLALDERKARRVVEIENQLYDLLDHASAGADVGVFIRFLQGFTRQSPAGVAYANRLAAEKKQME